MNAGGATLLAQQCFMSFGIALISSFFGVQVQYLIHQVLGVWIPLGPLAYMLNVP